MKPTVIRTDDKKGQVVKPTVIPIQSSPLPNPSTPITLKPTAMPITSKPEEVVTVVKPTAVPGFERKRIAVKLNDLEKLNPSAKSNILEKALQLILVTNLDEATDRTAVLWGHDLQRTYSDLVAKCLSLNQSEILSRVNGHIGRMMEILESIDLKKICGLEGGDNALSRFLKKATTSIDSLPELATAQTEISQLVKLMSDKLDELLSLKEELDQISGKIDESGDEVEASAIAAAFIADYINHNHQQTRGGLAQRFLERSMSLTQTLGQIRSSGSMREIQVEQPLRLISAVQHTALVMVPGWLSSIVSIRTMLEGRNKPTVTEIGELSDQMHKIVNQLKGK